MSWTAPTNPVAGQVITAAYAIANFVNNLIWLRGLTGAADPPGSDYTIRSTSTSATDWSKVTSSMLGTGAVQNGNVLNNDIDASTKLAAGSVTLAKMAAASVSTSQLVDLSVTNAKMADNVLDASTKLAAGSVTLAKMAANSVDSPQIVNGSIDPGHFAAQAVQAFAIANGNVQLVHMSTDSVDTSQLVAGAVTYQKMAALQVASGDMASPITLTTSNQTATSATAPVAGTYQVSVSVGLFTTTTAGDTNVSLYAELTKTSGVFQKQMRVVTEATALDRFYYPGQSFQVALAASEVVSIVARKSGGSGTSGIHIAQIAMERISA